MPRNYICHPPQGYNQFIEFINNLSNLNGITGLSLNQKAIAKTLNRSQSTVNDYIAKAQKDGFITDKTLAIYSASQKHTSYEFNINKDKITSHLEEHGYLPDESKAKEQISRFKEVLVTEKKKKRERQTAKTAKEVKKEYVHNEINIEYVERWNQMLWDLGQGKFRDEYLDEEKLRATNIICGTWNPENHYDDEDPDWERINKRWMLLKEFTIIHPVEFDVNGSIYRLTYNLTHEEQLSQEVDIYELFWKEMGYKQAFTKEVREALKNTCMPIFMKPQGLCWMIGLYKKTEALKAIGVKVDLPKKEKERFDSYKVWEEIGIDLKDLLYNLRDAMKKVLGVDKFYNRAIFYYESDLHAIMKVKFMTEHKVRTINAYDGFYGDASSGIWTEELFYQVYAESIDKLKEIIAESKEIKVFTHDEIIPDEQAKEEREITEEVKEMSTLIKMPTAKKAAVQQIRKPAKIKSATPEMRWLANDF